MRIALGCSHIDIFQGLRLLLWIEYLGGSRLPITVVVTRRAALTEFYPLITRLIDEQFDNAKVCVERTSHEKGWPSSATHIFGEALHFCSGDDMLWLEPDAVPIKSTWFAELLQEFEMVGKPFLGRFIPAAKTHPDHMSGIAIYGKDWASICPVLGQIDTAGMQAWDVDRAPWIIPHMHRSNLIQHKWVRHEADRSIPSEWVDKKTVLFHQDKQHCLPREIAPEFLTSRLTVEYLGSTNGTMMKYFMTENSRTVYNVGGREIRFETAVVSNGIHFGTLSAAVDSDLYAALVALVVEGKVSEIDQEDFDKFEVKKKSFVPVKSSFALSNLTDSLAPSRLPPAALAEAKPVSSPKPSVGLDTVLAVSKPGKR
jgi:hypothetical protein